MPSVTPVFPRSIICLSLWLCPIIIIDLLVTDKSQPFAIIVNFKNITTHISNISNMTASYAANRFDGLTLMLSHIFFSAYD